MRNIKVVDFTYGRRSSDDVNTSLPFTDNYKESKTIQQANAVIASYINENIKDIAEVNSNLDDLVVEVESKQDELISGTNIKTINGETILGSGDISVVSDVSWGDITGDIDDQTDLKNALADKQDELVSGENIKTINGGSILGDGNIVVQSTITGGATTITGNNLTANRTLISDSNGKVAVSSVTTTDLTRMKNDSIYSTNEIIIGNWIGGETIYRKVINDLPDLPSNSTLEYSLSSLNINYLVELKGWAKQGTSYRPLILVASPITSGIRCDIDIGVLRITTFANWSGWTPYVILEYTKTTD